MGRYRGRVCVLTVITLWCGCGPDDQSGTAAAPPPPEVSVSEVVRRDVTEFGEYTGRTDSVATVDVRARVSGYLTQVAFVDGEEVKQGDLLFRIDPRPFEAALKHAEGQKAQWQAKLARAQADVARYEKLVPTGAATAQDLDKVRADQGEAVAAIQSAEAAIDRAKLDLEFSRITAPIGGQVSRALITMGNLVRGDQDLLTTIVSLDPIFVYFSINERDALQFRNRAREATPPDARRPDIRSMNIPVYVGLANEEGYPHQGSIDFADNRVDPSTGTIQVRGTLENSKRVFNPGLFARVRVPLSKPIPSVLVTDRAIGTDQSQRFVYIVDDKNIAQYRAVRLGRLEDDGLRVVTEGLHPGERVVVTGIQRARPGKPVAPQRIEMPRLGPAADTRPAVIVPAGANAPAEHTR